MTEMKLYTAVGRFINQKNNNGQAYPAIILGGKEYLVDPQEFMIWINANWRICRWEDIGKHYAASASEAGYYNERSWQSCTQRLLVRGLLICGCGETRYDALYDLLSSMYIIPTRGRVSLRLFVALKMMLQGKVSFSAARKLFRSIPYAPKEKAILRLVNQAMVSTAEIICCIHKGVQNIRNENVLLDTVYADSRTTSDNICHEAKYIPFCQEIVESVANLYLNQQLIFDRA